MRCLDIGKAIRSSARVEDRGPVREYLPKGETITSDPRYLTIIADDISDRPREIHAWKKPSEVFADLIESHASIA